MENIDYGIGEHRLREWMATMNISQDRLLRVLMVWSAITLLVFWLPAVRGLLDGPTYAWSAFGFNGGGTGGDYWFPALASAAALGFFLLSARGAGPVFQAALVGWHVIMAGGAINLAITEPNSFRFRGDTLGLDVSLVWVGPVLFGGFALATILWVVRDGRMKRSREPVWPWDRPMSWWVVGLVPLQFILLRFGEPHGVTDQIGVLVTIAQWILLGVLSFPGPESGVSASTSRES